MAANKVSAASPRRRRYCPGQCRWWCAVADEMFRTGQHEVGSAESWLLANRARRQCPVRKRARNCRCNLHKCDPSARFAGTVTQGAKAQRMPVPATSSAVTARRARRVLDRASRPGQGCAGNRRAVNVVVAVNGVNAVNQRDFQPRLQRVGLKAVDEFNQSCAVLPVSGRNCRRLKQSRENISARRFVLQHGGIHLHHLADFFVERHLREQRVGFRFLCGKYRSAVADGVVMEIKMAVANSVSFFIFGLRFSTVVPAFGKNLRLAHEARSFGCEPSVLPSPSSPKRCSREYKKDFSRRRFAGGQTLPSIRRDPSNDTIPCGLGEIRILHRASSTTQSARRMRGAQFFTSGSARSLISSSTCWAGNQRRKPTDQVRPAGRPFRLPFFRCRKSRG